MKCLFYHSDIFSFPETLIASLLVSGWQDSNALLVDTADVHGLKKKEPKIIVELSAERNRTDARQQCTKTKTKANME